MMRPLVLTMFFFFSCVSYAAAHPMAKIDATLAPGRVDIVVTHEVDDPATHYVSEIKIKVNGRETVIQKFNFQAGNELKVSYVLPGFKKGDIIDVKAVCNRLGNLTQSYQL